MKALIFIMALVLALAASWGIVVGIIYAICALMQWAFSLRVATAIWLVFCLLDLLLTKPRKD